MKALRLSLLIVLLIPAICLAEEGVCGRCEGETPRYLTVVLNNIEPVDGNCYNWGVCNINSSSINGTYELELMESETASYCKWAYVDSDPNIVSTRSRDAYTDVATGLEIRVEKRSYDTMSIIACSIASWPPGSPGYAYYFSADVLIESGCVANRLIENGTTCYCSVGQMWPPWSAGISGTASVRELWTNPLCINLIDFAEFAEDWLGEPNETDFEIFLDDWLQYCEDVE